MLWYIRYIAYLYTITNSNFKRYDIKNIRRKIQTLKQRASKQKISGRVDSNALYKDINLPLFLWKSGFRKPSFSNDTGYMRSYALFNNVFGVWCLKNNAFARGGLKMSLLKLGRQCKDTTNFCLKQIYSC